MMQQPPVCLVNAYHSCACSIGFSLLKDVLGDAAFFGKKHPDCFITDNCEAEKQALYAVWPHSNQHLCIFHLLRQVWRWLCTSGSVKKEDRPDMIRVVQRLLSAKTHPQFMEAWESYLSGPHARKYKSYTK